MKQLYKTLALLLILGLFPGGSAVASYNSAVTVDGATGNLNLKSTDDNTDRLSIQTGGGDIYMNSNVGIGTTAPAQDLVVVNIVDDEMFSSADLSAGWSGGDEFVTGYTYTYSDGNGGTLAHDSALNPVATNGTWYEFQYTIANTSGTITAEVDTTFAETAVPLTITDGSHSALIQAKTTPGNFTIAVTSAEGSFEINAVSLKEVSDGDIFAGGTVTADAFIGDGSGLTNLPTATPGGSDGYIQFKSGTDFAGSGFLQWDNANNRLGIGVAAPSTKLDVDGTVRITGPAYGAGQPITGTLSTSGATVTGDPGNLTVFQSEFTVGDQIKIATDARTITAIASDTSMTVDAAFSSDASTGTSAKRYPARMIVRDDDGTVGMIISSTGKMSLGTNVASPGAELTISGDLGTNLPGTTSATLSLLDNTSQEAGVGGGITFSGKYLDSGTPLNDGPFIKASKTNSTSGDYSFDLKLGVRENGSGTQTTSLILKDSGNVGIGTTTPLAPFHLDTHNTNGSAEMMLTNDEDKSWSIASSAHNSSGNFVIVEDNDISGQSRIVINPGGQTGIGTITPDAQLSIKETFVVALDNTVSVADTTTITSTAHGLSAGDLVSILSGDNNTREKRTVSASNLTPDKFEVTVNLSNAATIGSTIYKDSATDLLSIKDINSVERFVVEDTGNVGIGTASPTQDLVVVDLSTESLTDTTDFTTGNWTNDGGEFINGTYTYNAGGNGTLSQTIASPTANAWYQFEYTITGTAGTTPPTAEITTSFAETATSLPVSDGSHSVMLLSKAPSPEDFIISATGDSGDSFSFSSVSLKEVSDGDIFAGGTITAASFVGIGTATPTTALEIKAYSEDNTRFSQDSQWVYTELAQESYAASAGLMWNAYRVPDDSQVEGSLVTLGNTKYKKDAGEFNRGAAGIFTVLNGQGTDSDGGQIYIATAPSATAADANITWNIAGKFADNEIVLTSEKIELSGNVGIGATAFGTSAANTLGMAVGTAPTTSPADTVQIWSEDLSGAGTAGLKIRNENDSIITFPNTTGTLALSGEVTPLTAGASNQIPFTNTDEDDITYDSNFVYDDANNDLIVLGTPQGEKLDDTDLSNATPDNWVGGVDFGNDGDFTYSTGAGTLTLDDKHISSPSSNTWYAFSYTIDTNTLTGTPDASITAAFAAAAVPLDDLTVGTHLVHFKSTDDVSIQDFIINLSGVTGGALSFTSVSLKEGSGGDIVASGNISADTFQAAVTTSKGTCTATKVGQIVYEEGGVEANLGVFFGCKRITSSTFDWVALEAFSN